MSRSVTPRGASASSTALTTAAGAPIEPASPQPLAPSGLWVQGWLSSHSVTNAAVLPRSLAAMAGREPEAIAELAAALGTDPDGLTARVSALAGGARLGLDEAELPAAADAALERSELAALSPPPGRDELVEILRRAL